MSKNATHDLAQGLAHDLKDVADDLRGIVETVVVPKVGSAVHAAAERVPDTVVDRLPWWDASTPVLHGWRHGELQCSLSGTAILCRNGDTAVRIAADGFAVAG